MKKFHFSFLFVIALLLSTQSFAQLAIDKGTKFINLGIGVGGYGYYSGGGGIGLNAAADFGVAPNITVGGVVGYRSYGSVASYNYNSFDIGARGSYHFNQLLNLTTDKADLYAGLGLSYFSFSYGGFADNYGTVYVPVHVGGRYFFSEKLGAFAELGSSLATLKLGLTLKL
ncbi:MULTISPECIES: hypothetical protein [Spirosoma]|uniref:Outer membrane protein beta-barrel domain-containing protein n=1 Tax=Spirosoma liriopis TaxID=2937440 RepID=A0ABT0HU65_9BACT|nr:MULTISPECIES: hypothetical protein [Spirosoma]MCK8495684.1 hypothetical protein [Spirosoma liriopis]UHG91378.1 hypothetical protein LQ777_00410 [Spirosoma oryzicola]